MTAIGEWLTRVQDLPRLDCELLLAKALELSRAQIIAYPERSISPQDQRELDAQVHALRRGTPLAYVLGKREFWALDFKVTPAVLIPRPETELLVELSIALAPRDGSLLELGTGSGAIAIAIATERPDLRITATDISAAALEVAEANAKDHDVAINFVQSAWFADLQGRWDIIVSNPPYIAPHDPHLEQLQAEPQGALVAGNAGLSALQHISAASPAHLHTGGRLLLEHGYNQAGAVRAAMQDAGFDDVYSKRDLASIERATVGCMTPEAER